MIYDIGFGRNIWPSVEVEGEFARETELVKVIGGRPSPNRDVELDEVPVTLIPERDNRHDKNAITVQAKGHIVGYLSRADAVRYQQPIYRITASGAAAGSQSAGDTEPLVCQKPKPGTQASSEGREVRTLDKAGTTKGSRYC